MPQAVSRHDATASARRAGIAIPGSAVLGREMVRLIVCLMLAYLSVRILEDGQLLRLLPAWLAVPRQPPCSALPLPC